MPKPFDFIRIRKSWATFAFRSTHLEKTTQFVAEIMKKNVFFTLDVWRSCCFSFERCSVFILFASQCIRRNINDIQIRISCVLRIYPDKANKAIQAYIVVILSASYFLSTALCLPLVLSLSSSLLLSLLSLLLGWHFHSYSISQRSKNKNTRKLGECVFQCSLIVGTTHKNKHTTSDSYKCVCDVSNTVESIK